MTPFRRRLVDYGLAAALLAAPILLLQAGLREPSSLNCFDQAVLRYNEGIAQFPAVLLALLFGFKPGRGVRAPAHPVTV